jgi:exodeoxyribonuclease VII small subunit
MSAATSATMSVETGQEASAIEGLTFRAGSEELERIVRQLEGDQLELEESLVLYERGVRLLRYLQAQLDTAQQKVTVLMGELEPADDEADQAIAF